MTDRKVLIISDFDPSSPFIGSLRVDRFGSHLTSLGWSVRTVSAAGITAYRPDGKDVPPAAATSHYRRPLRRGLSGLVYRILLWVFYHLVALPDRGIVTLPRIARYCRDLDDWRPDVILVSGPPFSAYLVARRLSRAWGVPWVADYRDLWTNSNYYPCGPIRRRMDRVVERWILRTVGLTLTVSEPLAEDLRRDFGVRCEVVMNGFEPDEFGGERAKPTPGLPLNVVYTGEVHPGRSDPEAFLDAVRSLGVGAETLQVEFRGITVMPLAEQARAAGVEELVRFGPAVPRAESLRMQQAADVQLLLLWNHPGEVGNYSGKLFEYLGSGRPILMMGYPGGVAARLVVDRGAGHVVNTSREVATVLARWIEEKRTTGVVAGTGPDTIQGLTRREQTQVLDRLLTELVTSSPRAAAGRAR